MDARSAEITNLLKAWSGGDPAALERLAEQVYPEFRLMARRYIKGSEQECVEGRILGCFPEDDKFGLGRRHPLRFQQEVMEVLVAPASP